MPAVEIGLCLVMGACIGILGFIGVLVWFLHDQLGDL